MTDYNTDDYFGFNSWLPVQYQIYKLCTLNQLSTLHGISFFFLSFFSFFYLLIFFFLMLHQTKSLKRLEFLIVIGLLYFTHSFQQGHRIRYLTNRRQQKSRRAHRCIIIYVNWSCVSTDCLSVRAMLIELSFQGLNTKYSNSCKFSKITTRGSPEPVSLTWL